MREAACRIGTSLLGHIALSRSMTVLSEHVASDPSQDRLVVDTGRLRGCCLRTYALTALRFDGLDLSATDGIDVSAVISR